MDASVIVPTYNRRDSLRRCLVSLGEQTGLAGRFEVIVVDDGSTDGTAAMLNELKNRVGFELIVRNQRRSGSGLARNLGASIARGRVLLFTDSDCIARPGWARRMVEMVTQTGTAVGAPVDVPAHATLFARCLNFITHTWLGGLGSTWRLLGFIPGFRLRTMNLAMPRKLFRSVAGFRPISYGEDTELSERLLSLGHRLRRDSQANIVHCERRTALDYVLESYAKGRTVIRLLRLRLIPWRGIYITPMLLFTSVPVLLASSGFAGTWVAISLVLAYLVCLCAYGTRYARQTREPMTAVLVPLVAVIVHAAYAVGTARGIFSRFMPVKDEARPGRGHIEWVPADGERPSAAV